MKKLLIPFNKKIKADEKRLVGGKGLPLIELNNRGISIPEGFVITTEAYDLFLTENNLLEKIKDLSLASEWQKVQELIFRANMPKELEGQINMQIQTLHIDRYAVRSSANVEDSKSKSWAGEFESYLNIPSKEILNYVMKCWASVFSPRVIAYADSIENFLSIKMAVVIQQSIDSDISGVCFTRNPLDEDEDNISIEAIFGLGELLVQGQVTPDRYTVERRSGIILDIFVHPQEKMHTTSRNGGTKTITIKPNYRQKLSGKEIKHLARLAQKIEKIYKNGQDIEWCIKKDNLYILQSRPITSKST